MMLTLLLCRETLKRLDDYLDGELSSRENRMVSSHLKICQACAEKFAFERDFTDALRLKLQLVSTREDHAMELPEIDTKRIEIS